MDNYKAIYLKWLRTKSFGDGFCETDVEAVPDDAFESFAVDMAEWVGSAKLPMAKLWRETISRQADAMYAALTGDIKLDELRFPPKIHINYFPAGDYYSPGQLWIFYKMENNGTTLRVMADLDCEQLLAVIHGDTEGDGVTHPIIHSEMITLKNRRNDPLKFIDTEANISVIDDSIDQTVAIKLGGGVTIYVGGRLDGSTFAQRKLPDGEFQDMYFPSDASLGGMIRAAIEWGMPF